MFRPTLQVTEAQRLDVGVDLDVGSEIIPNRAFKLRSDGVRRAKLEPAVELQVERHDQTSADRVHDDMMHRKA